MKKLLLILLFFEILNGQAQILVSRNFSTIFIADSSLNNSWFGKTAYAAELNRGLASKENEQAWNMKFNGFFELYRWKSTALINIYSQELNCNVYNPLGFNPRGNIWNEQISLIQQRQNFQWETGISYRCRHDLDNADPPNQNAISTNYVPLQRVLVVAAVFLAASKNFVFSENIALQTSAKAEYFGYMEDNRRNGNKERSWEKMQGSMLLTYKMEFLRKKKWQIYQRTFLNACFFGEGNLANWNSRAEIGGQFKSKKAVFQCFSAYEYFFDDVSVPKPQFSEVFNFGFRIQGIEFW